MTIKSSAMFGNMLLVVLRDTPLHFLNNYHKTIYCWSNEGDLVLDNCIGSGTTAIAAINTNRNYIGIELDEKYYNIAQNRINEHKNNILLK